ncbi:MAG: hypothetical protein ACM3ZF_05940 [Mycobacterium leprae]
MRSATRARCEDQNSLYVAISLSTSPRNSAGALPRSRCSTGSIAATDSASRWLVCRISAGSRTAGGSSARFSFSSPTTVISFASA